MENVNRLEAYLENLIEIAEKQGRIIIPLTLEVSKLILQDIKELKTYYKEIINGHNTDRPNR